MNNVSIIGRLVRDPELRYTPKGKEYLFLSIAVNKIISKEKKEEMEKAKTPTADFFNVIAWGKQAENGANFLKKGLKVAVTGSLESGRYEKSGERVYYTRIRANQIDFLEWAREDEVPPEGFHWTPEDSIDEEYIPF